MMIVAKVGVLTALFVLALLALFWPTVASAGLSAELEDILIDESGDSTRMFELFGLEAVDPAGAAAAYSVIMEDQQDRRRRYRLGLLCRAIVESLGNHADLLEFLSGLVEDTRPFRSLLIAKFLLVRLDHVSEQEFQELNAIVLQDIDVFVGRRNGKQLTSLYDLITNRYLAGGRYSPADPDADFNILEHCFCRAGSREEQNNLALALRNLDCKRAARLFEREFLGLECFGSSGMLAGPRTMLSCIASSPEGAEILTGLLPELRDDGAYSMALLVCGLQKDFHNDLGFHRAVFRSLSQRSHVDGDGEESMFRAPGEVAWAMSGYFHQVWPNLSEAIAFRPHELAEHAGLISRFAGHDSILEFAASYGKLLEEPFLSSFTERIYSDGLSDKMKAMLDYVGRERLPIELRERTESLANKKWIPVMDRVIVIPEPSNDGRSSGRRRR